MNRISVIDPDTSQALGWFDLDKAERFHETREWDGHTHVGIITGSQWHYADLVRTAGGRWLFHHHSAVQGERDNWQYATDDEARDWLIRNQDEDSIATYFGETEPERAPPGRPAIGEPVNVRLGELLGRVDVHASLTGVTRAEAIRSLVAAGLKAEGH